MAIAYVFKEKVFYRNKEYWVVGIHRIKEEIGYHRRDLNNNHVYITSIQVPFYHRYDNNLAESLFCYTGIGHFSFLGYKSRLKDFIKTKKQADETVKNILKSKQAISLYVWNANENTHKKKTIEFFPQIQRPIMKLKRTQYWTCKSGTIFGYNFYPEFNKHIIDHIAKLANVSKRNIILNERNKGRYVLSKNKKFCDFPSPITSINECVYNLKKFIPRAKYEIRVR